MKSKRTKALEIPIAVKRKVYERDGHKCVFCGRYCDVSNACCHFIPRSSGGLGIEENILTLCADCHRRYDQSEHRTAMRKGFKMYLSEVYTDWSEDKLIYDRWRFFND